MHPDLSEILAALRELRTLIGDVADRLLALEASASARTDEWMTLAEAEKTFSISMRELWRLMDAGELPYAQPTRQRLVPRQWFRDYLASRTQNAAGVSR